MSESVWVVVKQGVHFGSVYFVGRYRAEAELFCDQWAPDGDGWHTWVIEEMKLGQPVTDSQENMGFTRDQLTRWEDRELPASWSKQEIASQPRYKIVPWEGE